MKLSLENCNQKTEYVKSQLVDNFDAKSAYYRFGVEKFGPFVYGYTQWLYESVSQRGITKVFFFARDGYMMQKAFDYFNQDNKITTKYVYFSRKSIRQALLYSADTYREVLKFLPWERFISIAKLLELYGFTDEEREEIATQEGLNLEDEIKYSDLPDDKSMEDLYNKLKERIDEKSKEQCDLLSLYLDEIGLSGECAIVDIGWHGNMQYYLEQFCKIQHRDASLHGYYVGIDPVAALQGSVDGWLYNPDNLEHRKDVLCFLGGYEKLFQSCEGSTYGYEKVEGTVIPRLMTYEYEGDKQIIHCIDEWQNGALDYVRVASKNKLALDNNVDFAAGLIEFGKKPSNADVKLFSFFYNLDGSKTYFVAQKSLWKYKPRELMLACANSPWKTGFLKSAFKMPFPYYLIYRALRK